MQNRPQRHCRERLHATKKGLLMAKKSVASPATIGSAVFVAKAENGSPEWHELRRLGLGGSDIAAVCKVSPWSSPWSVWAKKTGNLEDASGTSEAMEWGTRLEDVILDKFTEDHSDLTLMRNAGTWAHKERPWQLANPDAIYLVDGEPAGIVEVKTARYEDDWASGVPAYYRTQVLWYSQTFGFKQAFVVVLFGGQKYREFEVTLDEFEAEANLAEAEKMWALIQSQTQPEFDGMFATLETVRALNPDIDQDASVELGDLYLAYYEASSAVDEATKILNEMKSRVLDAMGTAKRGLFDDRWVLTRQSKNGGTPFLVTKKG
jgi:putative phage-type endonuclease